MHKQRTVQTRIVLLPTQHCVRYRLAHRNEGELDLQRLLVFKLFQRHRLSRSGGVSGTRERILYQRRSRSMRFSSGKPRQIFLSIVRCFVLPVRDVCSNDISRLAQVARAAKTLRSPLRVDENEADHETTNNRNSQSPGHYSSVCYGVSQLVCLRFACLYPAILDVYRCSTFANDVGTDDKKLAIGTHSNRLDCQFRHGFRIRLGERKPQRIYQECCESSGLT
mmetsp:Transcript_18578/g.46071  ORF Transcript_18578/g.46071 Transcript_18578/m.46071 type:complete len:223 (+) Transcript_18578:506-1174(+)